MNSPTLQYALPQIIKLNENQIAKHLQKQLALLFLSQEVISRVNSIAIFTSWWVLRVKLIRLLLRPQSNVLLIWWWKKTWYMYILSIESQSKINLTLRLELQKSQIHCSCSWLQPSRRKKSENYDQNIVFVKLLVDLSNFFQGVGPIG